MEVRRTVIREVRRVLLVNAAATVVMLLALKLAGLITVPMIWGIVSGFTCGMANFCLLAATILRIGTAENSDPAVAKRIMKKSYALRMAFMAAFSIAAIIFLKVNLLTYAMMLVLPGFTARIRRR